MRPYELASLFEEIADLLEFNGENLFRVRAYRRAAQGLERFGGDLEALAKAGRLRELPGVGHDLSEKIAEYLATGGIGTLVKLRETIPEGILDILEVPGVGPKTARQLMERLQITTVDALEAAARSKRLRTLPGFQEKKEANILRGVKILKEGRQRLDLGRALTLADQVLAVLRKIPGMSRVSVAGSLRRMRETIGDLDFLGASSRPEDAMAELVKSPLCARVLVSGRTKTSFLTPEGVQVDLRVVPTESFGAALQYFTGSKEHNVRLRELAARHGLKVNEYGVFKSGTNRRVAGREEADIYRALGLAYIPPELREDQGELDAAKTGRLPSLVELHDIHGDFHVHTNWSDGSVPLEAMAEAGETRGYQYLAICDHSRSLTVAHGMTVERLRQQMAVIRALNARVAPFRVLMGAEVDILQDGSMDYPDAVLRELDVVVGSVHSGFAQSEAVLTKRIVTAMRNPYVTLIGHPTGRLLGQRPPYAVNLEAVYRAACETGTALEMNAHPKRLDLPDAAARRAHEAGVMLAISTDTHHLEELGYMRIGVASARRAWVGPARLLNCLRLQELLAWIAKKRARRRGR